MRKPPFRTPSARRSHVLRALLLVLVALVMGVLSACVASPRNDTTLRSKAEPVQFAGLFEVPDTTLELQAFSFKRERWIRFGSVRTSSQDPVTDTQGRPYFRYTASVSLPQAPEYWSAQPDGSGVQAQVRVAHIARGTHGADGAADGARDVERVLSVFDASAETCARRAHEGGKSEIDALSSCSNLNGAFARISVRTCGGDGEPCCASEGRPACDGALSCDAGSCQTPSYAPPVITDYQVDLAVASEYELRDAALVMDDTSGASDSERPLLVNGQPTAGVRVTSPHPNVARLTFDLGLWQPGRNRFFVRGSAWKGQAKRDVASNPQHFDYAMPRTLGMRGAGNFLLPKAHFPMHIADCRGPVCKDRDGDGLNDLWENAALEQLRPRLMMDSGDQLFESKDDVVRVLTSVIPMTRKDGEYVLFANVITFTRDYGFVLDHPGDTEAFGMLYRLSSSGSLHWVASVAKGHQCMLCGPEFAFHAQDFDDHGVPLLFVEKDKHGVWQSGAPCREKALYRCRGDRAVRPNAINIGDASEHGRRALVDTLDGIATDGPFAQLAGIFPGDAIWSGEKTRVSGRFCGGRRDCSESRSANLPGTVVGMIVQMFERGYADGR
jgi:hypothetical protein